MRAGRVFKTKTFWGLFGLGWALMEALAHRYAMNPDGLSYLDMAWGGELVNPVWSPLYPATIRAAFSLLRPVGLAEIPAVHAVNFLIFLFTFGCFGYFLDQWSATGDEPRRQWAVPFGFATFLWVAMEILGLGAVNPDMAVAGFVFLAAGLGCRLSRADAGMMHYAILGLVLGVAYYAKAAMLPLGLALLGLMAVYPPSGRRRIEGIALAAVVLGFTAAPLVGALSVRAGHFSMGDSGRLNYLWHVNGVEHFSGWTGPGAEHAPRVAMERPRVLEFGQPVGGTYPLWFDPSYWYAGAKTRIDLGQQARAVAANLNELLFALPAMAGLVAGGVLLWALGSVGTGDGGRNPVWMIAWAGVALAMFLAVHLEMRYIAGFLVLGWIAVYDLLMRGVDGKVFGASAGVGLLAMYLSVMTPLLVDAKAAIFPKLPPYVAVAETLERAGLGKGARLACAGYAFDAYYARVVSARVVAEIDDSLWRLDAGEWEALRARLMALGVDAIVALDRPPGQPPGAWQDVPASGARYSVLVLGR